ncbi:ureidoglycolate lyase [Endozoicomonas sp. SM1973]|uniref:Ureidoglycolate lyase n=1 Tax=Spartinivicinus marinus TaxID=2994442 RepID=A0A853I120_9GAMM|nr:ureidoglycolate lyase [Spartinivicinus marinus]MCX4029518.1 ureidoglycolate lyase [Spartinivicinus marinus]NYZ65092.1 ureidoglycolate lyase [Spartinivicinus marinus]
MHNPTIQPKPLTKAGFAPFGDLIEVNEETPFLMINQGYTQRFHDLATIDASACNGTPLLSIFRSKPLSVPVKLTVMEHHPLSSQTFYPLSQYPYLVAVAPKGPFDMTAIEVFLAQPWQGVNYHPGTWHHFCLALQHTSDFLVIDRGGKGNNCEEVYLPTDQQIIIELS